MREQRDAVNAKVIADPRLKRDMSDMPFEGKRMIFGGFATFLELDPQCSTKSGINPWGCLTRGVKE